MKKWAVLALFAGSALANDIPANASKYIPILNKSIDQLWPSIQMRSYFAAQIEQETCITLKHSKCWNPRAELKTSREYGFGLGQFTIAYTADGKERFNVWKETKAMSKALKDWEWEDRYNPEMQIKAMIIKNKVNYGTLSFAFDEYQRMAFLAATYNGGSTFRDRKLCEAIKGCFSNVWFGNVELHSVKSKTKIPGYGKSFFEINREYVRNVIINRRPKYVKYMGDKL